MVINGTGKFGGRLVRLLAARGADVRVLTRYQHKADSVPFPAAGFVGNLQDIESVRAAFRGVERVFLLTANCPTEMYDGLTAVQAAVEAGVRHLVFLSAQGAGDAPQVPHFAAKISIEMALKSSGLTHAILRAPYFYQNDDWSRDAILAAGAYLQPIGNVGVARVDLRDVADAAANLLTSDMLVEGTYVISGPGSHTGDSAAWIWSEAMGRRIVYAGDDLKLWQVEARAVLPEWRARDLRLMYRHLQASGLSVTQKDLDRQALLLSRPPRSYEDFVLERAAEWCVPPCAPLAATR